MRVKISDDFDLWKIANCGQAFRVKEFSDGTYRFIFTDQVLYITETCEKNVYEAQLYDFGKGGSIVSEVDAQEKWDQVWKPYFDLDRNYAAVRESVRRKDTFLTRACECGQGLRILRQDYWEMLITFITSQRKSIPAIKDAIERMCEKYGKTVETEYEKIHLFPTAFDMKKASCEELKECKLGYRVDYILDAISKIIKKEIALEAISVYSYEKLFDELKKIKGVGDKVSNCICLFAYGKTEAAPVDTWIAKVIDNYYSGINPFNQYGKVAGIMQQYIFYYAQMNKDEF